MTGTLALPPAAPSETDPPAAQAGAAIAAPPKAPPMAAPAARAAPSAAIAPPPRATPDGTTALDEPPGQGERFGAAWRQGTIAKDAYAHAERLRVRRMNELFDALPASARDELVKDRFRMDMKFLRFPEARAKLFEQIDRQRRLGTGNQVLLHAPRTEDEFNAEIEQSRRAQWDEANRLLAVDGPGIGGFLGGMARDLVDPINLAIAPFGVSGGVLRTFASETVLGGVAAGAGLPREFAVANELNLPKPDPMQRIVTEALASGVLGAGLHALVRGAQTYRTRRRIKAEGAPPGMPQALHEEAQAEAEARLNGDLPPLHRPVTDDAGNATWRPPDFDVSLRGNASPRTNRAGYVFVRMIEKGIPPHIAAGYVGNFMVESGRSLNFRAVGDGGNAYGIAQWNGPRRRALFAYTGTTDPSLDQQIDFWLHEIQTTEASAHSRIMRATTAEEAAQLVSDLYERPGVPHMNTRVGHAASLIRQYEDGKVPAGGSSAPTGYVPYTTSRATTLPGQVRTAAGSRIDVEYVVVDAGTLTRASGDLQPRDRSLANSDDQVSAIAADLDPALLTPAPTADRGTPIVGPDNVIESGNGRFAAIERAYSQHPDRADAYRQQIEALGFDIPGDVRRPVLIARRTSVLDDDARRSFVVEAQDSGIARMTPVERARAEAQMLNGDVLSRLDPAHELDAPQNGDFLRAALSRLPQSERNAMVTPEGQLNADGRKALARALFARAYDDPVLMQRFAEADAGDLRALLDALFEAAPDWSRLVADVAEGRVRPEFDITGHVLEAMRVIAQARKGAKEGGSVGEVLAELLNTPDLIEGAVPPLTRALLGLFWSNGRAAPKARISDFLRRYATEARKVGGSEASLLDAPDVIDVLQAVEPRAFADLVELGSPPARNRVPDVDPDVDPVRNPVRSDDFADGALSDEVAAADDDLADELTDALAGNRLTSAEEADGILADGDFDMPLGEGESIKASDLLADVQEDMDLETVIDLCVRRGGDA